MNKKAILISEVLKMILSVMGIVLLLILAAQLFGLIGSKTTIEQAKEHMDKIDKIISRLEEQGGGSEDYVLLSPKGWVLTGWPSQGYTAYLGSGGVGGGGSFVEKSFNEEVPRECSDNGWNNCICFCKKGSGNNFLEWCNELSVCNEVFKKEMVVNVDSRTSYNQYVEVGSLIKERKLLKIGLSEDKLELNV